MYQVIARKYRPQTFDEVVGQGHVKRTLRNALEQGRIAHGYIFSGPRGTGKTTLARILAMALNCEGGPTASPDPASQVCQEIAAGSSLDVVEIDAASNRRIDDIRELRESVKFRPVRDPYKVFIIDEAHQITTDAFNALLKTLEEPPEWTVFVLCTTEPQAIPATIASRCQSFAFRAVDLPEVLEHLRGICRREGIEADEDALLAVALAGDGSIRDSLSTLDQAIAAFGQKLEAQGVRDLLGAIPSEVTQRILATIRDGDAAAMLSVADELFREGRHPQHFCGELARQFRNLMVMKLAGTATHLVVAGEAERQAAEQWLPQFSTEDLTRAVQVLLALYQDLQNATQQRFRLELGLLKLVYAARLQPLEKVLAGLASGAPQPAAPPRSAARSAAAAEPAAAVAAPVRTAPRPSAPPPAAPPVAPAPAPRRAPADAAQSAAKASPPSLAQRLVEAIERAGAPSSMLVDAIRACRLERQGSQVVFYGGDQWATVLEMQKSLLEATLFSVLGAKVGVRLEGGQPGAAQVDQAVSSPRTASSAATGDSGDAAERRARSDPAFLEFQRRFEGRVSAVRDLKEEAS